MRGSSDGKWVNRFKRLPSPRKSVLAPSRPEVMCNQIANQQENRDCHGLNSYKSCKIFFLI